MSQAEVKWTLRTLWSWWDPRCWQRQQTWSESRNYEMHSKRSACPHRTLAELIFFLQQRFIEMAHQEKPTASNTSSDGCIYCRCECKCWQRGLTHSPHREENLCVFCCVSSKYLPPSQVWWKLYGRTMIGAFYILFWADKASLKLGLVKSVGFYSNFSHQQEVMLRTLPPVDDWKA